MIPSQRRRLVGSPSGACARPERPENVPMMWPNRIANELSTLFPVATADLPTAPSAPRRFWHGRLSLPRPMLSSFVKGDRVRIFQGLFRGVEGTVVGYRGKGRLIIAVELMEQGVTIEVDVTMVQLSGSHPRPRFPDSR